jgi:hypothetical protein
MTLGTHTSTPGRSKGNENVLVFSDLLLEGLVVEVHELAGKLALDLWLQARLLCDELAQALKLVALSIEPLDSGEA